jgi:type VI secretion system protein VasD
MDIIRMQSSFAMLCVLCLLPGCAGGGAAAGAGAGADKPSLAKAALEAVGLRKPPPPPLPEALQPPRNVTLRLHAAKRLNVDARGQSLALLVRVYKLRQRAAFDAAPYAAFQSAQAEREALGTDLVEVKEITLVPGQQLDLADKLARDTGWLGIVALYHSPARDGWRLAFAAADAEQAGVTVGLHACAMNVGSGAGASGAGVKPMSLVRCQ